MDSVLSGINVETAVCKKPDQGHIMITGKADSQTGGCPDCSDHGKSSHQGFLDKLKTGSAAEQKDVSVKRQHLLTHGPTKQFVDSIMATNVFK